MVDNNLPPAGFLAAQARVFTALAAGAPLAQTLALVAQLTEGQLPGALCSVLLLDERGQRLRPGAPSDLPAEYDAWIGGLPAGPDGAGPFASGLAVAADLATDPAWERWRAFPHAHGLRACWSRPLVTGRTGEPVGTVALFFREPREPRPAELEILSLAAHFGALAVARSHSEDRFRAVFEHTRDLIFLFDDTRRVADANPAVCLLLGAGRESIIGQPIDRFLKNNSTPGSPGREERWTQFVSGARREGECTVHGLDGGRHQVAFQSEANFLPGLHLCVAQDITHKKLDEEAVRCAGQIYRTVVETVETTHTGSLVAADERGGVMDANAEYVHLSGRDRHELESRVERRTAALARANEQIRSRARQQESVAELGRRALAGTDIDTLLQEATETVVAILGLEYGAVLEHADPESDELLLRASVGWPLCAPGMPVATTDPRTVEGYALQAEMPVTFEDLAVETRFEPAPGIREPGVVSGITVTIRDDSRIYGLLAARGKQARTFTPDDVHFMEAVANVLAAGIEHKRAEETVRLAQMGAVKANNAKIDFLSRMSHELRTPLNAILGFSQLLEIERLSTGQRESVEQIARAGRHLLELVNEVLDISRIDSGKIMLVPEPLAVEDLLREAVDLIRPLADMRHIELLTDPSVQKGSEYVLADRQRLRQVLLNLLSNAVKYNREGGSVTLRGGPAPDGRQVRITVTDTGMGISPENLQLLFTPFERLGAENTSVEGSGMGLALSRKLVETQGGELGVESTVGVGSMFWLDLPVAAAPAGEMPLFFEELLGAPFFQSEEEEIAPTAPVQRTVLHIEDNEANQRLIEMLLARRPTLRLLTASRGEQGLKMAREHHPDLILLDIHLPDTTGEVVLQSLRTDECTRDTPVVMVSADAAAVKQNQFNDIGANDYLLKPFNVTQFLKIIDEYLLRTAA